MAQGHEVYDAALAEKILAYVHDPLGFVYFAFPWGEPGTLLAREDGPDAWQIDMLDTIGAHLRSSAHALRIAVASGHGIGKSDYARDRSREGEGSYV